MMPQKPDKETRRQEDKENLPSSRLLVSLSLCLASAGGSRHQPADAGRWPTVPRFLAVVLQLALILLTIYLFKFEPNLPFLDVMCLAAGGFVIHAWLPPPFRLAFFCLLSLASAVFLLGWPTIGWLLGLGGGLIALCHLPVPLAYRVLLIALVGGMLAVWRSESREAFWPILGSMFMFRLIVFLYDSRRERHRPPLLQTLAYFFTLPNLCFTLFPIIDFKTFRQTYYDDEPYAIYQTGVAWIVRGLTHLLAYRIIKYYMLPAPHHVTDLPHLLLFLAANYALYLRVSGWFHIITGMLHLYGFNLPRTHHNYFLASSVSDVWRRINIYWKEFMAKIFFYPTFFALRGWGRRLALTLAALSVFFATWLLHSYQMFWLRSHLPLSWDEGFLWLSAGAVMAINLQLDLSGDQGESNEQKRSLDDFSPSLDALAGAVLALRIMGTFVLVSLFWSCWMMPQFPSTLHVLATSSAITVAGVGTVLGWVAGGVVVGAVVQLGRGWIRQRGLRSWTRLSRLTAALPAMVLLVLVAAGIPQMEVVLSPAAADVLASLRLETATSVEAVVAAQGYYENLADTSVRASPLFAAPVFPDQKGQDKQRKTQFPRMYLYMTQPVDDFLERELIPGWSGEVLDHRLTINSLGMRDREGITLEKPAEVCRLAFVGSSVVMGYGVGDEETFTRLLEKDLNVEPRRQEKGGRRIEVLNFGTGKSYALHRRALIERKVLAFKPDAVYYVAHQGEYEGMVSHLALLLNRGNELPAFLHEIVQEMGVGPRMPLPRLEARLQVFARRILRAIYSDIVQQCRQRGILPVWVYFPMTGVTDFVSESSEGVELAKETGFVVLNLTKWDAGHAPEDIFADRLHPNALGHQLIAERLNAELHQRTNALPACAQP